MAACLWPPGLGQAALSAEWVLVPGPPGAAETLEGPQLQAKPWEHRGRLPAATLVPSFALSHSRVVSELRSAGGTVTAAVLLVVGGGAAEHQGQELPRPADRRALLPTGHHHPAGGGPRPAVPSWLPACVAQQSPSRPCVTLGLCTGRRCSLGLPAPHRGHPRLIFAPGAPPSRGCPVFKPEGWGRCSGPRAGWSMPRGVPRA